MRRSPPVAFPAAYLCQIAVHADEEDIQAAGQRGQVLAPGAELDDVLGYEVVSRCGQRGDPARTVIRWMRLHA